MKVKKTRPTPLGASRRFNTFSDLLGLSSKTGLHPGTGLVIDSDSSGRRTTAARPTWTPWALPTPLSCLGWWRMCSGPADSPVILLGLCQIGFESLGRRGGALSLEIRPGQGLHSLLGHITSGVDQAPGLERLALLCVIRDGTVHVLQSYFSVPVGRYST